VRAATAFTIVVAARAEDEIPRRRHRDRLTTRPPAPPIPPKVEIRVFE
jgi:hypothetical protein